jgi:hypothetical protein
MAPTDKEIRCHPNGRFSRVPGSTISKVKQLGLVYFRDFLKKRARYLRLVNNIVDGANVTPINGGGFD